MIEEPTQLRVALQQMGRLLSALADLREQVLPKDPQLFAAMAEAPLEDLELLRQQVESFLASLHPVA